MEEEKMKTKAKKFLLISISLFIIFIVYTVLVKFIDIQAIGPNDSKVGFSSLNQIVHQWFPGNFTLYDITDWGSIVPIGAAFVLAIFGLAQWIQRKKLLRIDGNILALGVSYLLTFIIYLFFEFVVINRRPVLINGILEASYPSSTTMLSLVILTTCIDQVYIYIKNKYLKYILISFSGVYALFLVVGRIIAGVHWASDIIGAMLVSSALIFTYFGLKSLLIEKLKTESNETSVR